MRCAGWRDWALKVAGPLGFVMLLAVVVTRDAPVGLVAAGFGAVLSLIGARAAVRPSRPFRLETLGNTPSINTTRAVGRFYIAAGVIWAARAMMAGLAK